MSQNTTPDDRCCPSDYGGSHYHCANCGGPSGMMGHMVHDTFRCPPESERPTWWRRFLEEGSK